ncbi:MAG: PDZ domain-containing protein, partial [bacterium]|nr:PDZ domain-containing protein [bacterium]
KLLEKVVTATLGARADDKNRGWLGVKIATLPKVAAVALQIPVATATIITSVFKNSAAEKAGLAVGNIVISVDGVATPDSRSLAREVAGHRAGEQIEIKFLEPAKSSAEIVQRLKEKEKNTDEGALADFLADSYRHGFFGAKDVAEAVSWYQRSAEKGNDGALYSLATMYDKGDGVGKDRAEAVKWYRKAAGKGLASAMYRLGVNYASTKDNGIGRDTKKSMKWIHMAAEKGHVRAMIGLGDIYSDGKLYVDGNFQKFPGVVTDGTKAVKWYKKAAENDFVGAMYSLAVMYDNGDGVVKDEAEAIKWYRKAAEKGFSYAMYRLGLKYGYTKGTGVKRDAKKAMKWIHMAAEKGHMSAMNRLGSIYSFGKYQTIPGIVADGSEAVKWYKKAAEKGSADAMANLGYMYQHGSNIRRDYTEALKWNRKAEAKGDVRSFYNLGTMYDAGTGVSKGPETAAWYLLNSYKGGYRYVRKVLFEKSSALSTATRKAIQKNLQEAGVYSGTVDGKFGPGTRRALEAFKAKADAATQAKKKPVKSMSEEFGDIKELEKLD